MLIGDQITSACRSALNNLGLAEKAGFKDISPDELAYAAEFVATILGVAPTEILREQSGEKSGLKLDSSDFVQLVHAVAKSVSTPDKLERLVVFADKVRHDLRDDPPIKSLFNFTLDVAFGSEKVRGTQLDLRVGTGRPIGGPVGSY